MIGIIKQNENFYLKKLSLDNLVELNNILKKDKIMEFSLKGPHTLKMTEEFIINILKDYDKYGFGIYGVFFNDSNRLIGYAGIFIDEVDGELIYENSYRLDDKYWGKGWGTEVSKMITDFAFNDLNLEEIVSIIEPSNIASRRVAEKNGYLVLEKGVIKGKPVLYYGIDKIKYNEISR